MEAISLIQVPQKTETPIQQILREKYGLRYAYARSMESRSSNDLGQDYLTFVEDSTSVVFALCDGVGQSFYGNLAAKYLGDSLIEWLVSRPIEGSQAGDVAKEMAQHLFALTERAADLVNQYPLSENMPAMLRQVLERKKELGSETTLVAGKIEIRTGRVLLVWMGDSRLRIWDQDGETTNQLGQTFLTSERWSTRKGPVGDVHVYIGQTGNVYRVVAYSDGLARLDDRLQGAPPSNQAVDRIIAEVSEAPTSDDISLFEFWFGKSSSREIQLGTVIGVQAIFTPTGVKIIWNPVDGVDEYEVEVSDVTDRIVRQRTRRKWFELTFDPPMVNTTNLRVRAIKDEEAGEWSEKLTITLPNNEVKTEFQSETTLLNLAPKETLPQINPINTVSVVVGQDGRPSRTTSLQNKRPAAKPQRRWAFTIILLFILAAFVVITAIQKDREVKVGVSGTQTAIALTATRLQPTIEIQTPSVTVSPPEIKFIVPTMVIVKSHVNPVEQKIIPTQ